jgi:DUF971 family protein
MPESDASTMPVEIRRVDDREVHIAWADGHRTVFSNKYLRENCPCAGCADEFTGERTLDPAAVSTAIRAVEVSLVGRYAVQFRWSDGHSTGIYPFQRLRAWCACEACRVAAGAGGG